VLNANLVGVVSWHPNKAGAVSGYADLEGVARQLGIPSILIERNINDSESIASIQARHPDVILVMAWSQLLKADLLKMPSMGIIGRHNALLPQRRGRAPVSWALIHGLAETGVSLFWMDEGVDSGDLVAQRAVQIAPDDYPPQVLQKLNAATIELLKDVVPALAERRCPRIPQDHSRATYTHPRRPDMGLIDWEKSAPRLYNFIRGLSHPYPGAFTYLDLRRLNIWQSWVSVPQGRGRAGEVLAVGDDSCDVQTGDGVLRIPRLAEVQIKKGDRLGCE